MSSSANAAMSQQYTTTSEARDMRAARRAAGHPAATTTTTTTPEASTMRVTRQGVRASRRRAATSTAAAEAAPAPPVCHFNKLPAELLDMVYGLALDLMYEDAQMLANLPIPAIAQVKKEIRTEVLPIHFAKTNFSIAVGTNSNTPGKDARSVSGTIGLKREVHASLRGPLGGYTGLRSITLHIFSSHDIRRARERLSRNDANAMEFLIASLHITLEKGEIVTKRTEGNDHPSLREVSNPGRLIECFESAEDLAREIGQVENFKGFDVHDVDDIAKEFRVLSPRTKASKNGKRGLK